MDIVCLCVEGYVKNTLLTSVYWKCFYRKLSYGIVHKGFRRRREMQTAHAFDHNLRLHTSRPICLKTLHQNDLVLMLNECMLKVLQLNA